MPVPKEWRPEIGTRYEVREEDCCLHVRFEARLVAADFAADWWDLTWDNGVVTGTFPLATAYKEPAP